MRVSTQTLLLLVAWGDEDVNSLMKLIKAQESITRRTPMVFWHGKTGAFEAVPYKLFTEPDYVVELVKRKTTERGLAGIDKK